MFFPETPREIYRRNLLSEAICQLRFPTILRITADPPAAFQDRIRQQYPIFEQEAPTAFSKDLEEIVAGTPLAQGLRLNTLYKFVNEDRSRVLALTQDFLALTETKYERWNKFREEIGRAEAGFSSIYNPAFYERIGLRYRNVVNRRALGLEGRPWRELLNPALIGLAGSDTANELLAIQSQSRIRLPEEGLGFVIVRHGLGLIDNEPVYLIDSDFFLEERRDINNVFEILDGFNRMAARFFRWSITDVLREALGPNTPD